MLLCDRRPCGRPLSWLCGGRNPSLAVHVAIISEPGRADTPITEVPATGKGAACPARPASVNPRRLKLQNPALGCTIGAIARTRESTGAHVQQAGVPGQFSRAGSRQCNFHHDGACARCASQFSFCAPPRVRSGISSSVGSAGGGTSSEPIVFPARTPNGPPVSAASFTGGRTSRGARRLRRALRIRNLARMESSKGFL